MLAIIINSELCGLSAFGGKADMIKGVEKRPLIAMCGRLPVLWKSKSYENRVCQKQFKPAPLLNGSRQMAVSSGFDLAPVLALLYREC